MGLYSSPLIIGCRLFENEAGLGGGMNCGIGSFPRIINTTFQNNHANSGGGISAVFLASICIINCSIIGNRGGGLSDEILSTYCISNSIIWNNYPDQFFSGSQNYFANYSNIQGGFPGPGNIDKDPLFIGTGEHPLTLSSLSPCIDAGTDRDVPETDIRGFDRPMGGAPDMGAYEYQGGWPFTTRVYVRMPSHQFAPGDTVNCGIDIWNAEQKQLTDYPLFVLLDVLGSIYWAPGFTTDPDCYVIDVPPGLSHFMVLPDFTWPEDTGTIDGVVWYAALASPDMTALVGEVGVFDFGWSDH